MDLQKDIKKLVTYGLDKKLIMPEDEIYTINQYLEVFRLDEYEDPDIEGEEIILPEILDRLTDTAYDRYIIKSDDIVTRDLFDTKLMGILTPKPSQVIKEFRTYYEESPKKATEFFYEFSQDTDYIRRYRIKRDVNKRGRTLESVLKQYQDTVKPMHERYVEPSKKYANIVVPEGGKNLVALDMIVGRIQRHLEET